MALPLTTDADNQAIRQVIDASLTPAALPDAVVGGTLYRQAAEAEVVARFGSDAAAALPDLDPAREALRRAVLYLTGAMLAPAAPVLVSESELNWSATRAKFDPAARAAELRALYEQVWATLDPDPASAAPRLPRVFGLARGRRSRLMPGW